VKKLPASTAPVTLECAGNSRAFLVPKPSGVLWELGAVSTAEWTGTTLALAGFMLGEGMKKEAYQTAWGIYHVSYETKGYWFRTPEAWDITGNYRASMYMRPASIWAMEMTQPPKKIADAREAAPAVSSAGVGAK